MLQPVGSPIPLICISPASPEKPQPAPYSPFPDGEPDADDDGFRAKHLSPPPNMSPRHQTSPLRQSTSLVPKGLGREQFDILLKASRERRAILGAPEAPDLRKELAIKYQKNKQLERRARFLSKVSEPPSPTAATTPKTPPESPAILHCSLPSPGLESPRAVFASVSRNGCGEQPDGGMSHQGWVEQIDFRIPISKQRSAGRAGSADVKTPTKLRKFAPSLDEITTRMSSATLRRSSKDTVAFSNQQTNHSCPQLPSVTAEPRPKLNVGRLHMPLRELSPGASFANGGERRFVRAPPSALLTPALEVTTTFVPRTVRAAPFPLSESNLQTFSRSYTARDMIRTLKRRSLSPPPLGGCEAKNRVVQKRWSAPAELYGCGRTSFQHDVLSMPGSF
ncbi:hypothetical protein BKA82DRAFT_148106 [Pisolithus tinctorius]|uniref:Uncharacterized protein n=1 Tax=Pisolithus tinctorius Marx 270 TaxID=870435 RepID=A0A0C3P4U6_PISTI|nr:hypothetical protein BKA82DRAFT_148106 [Pisolithus tinctorius]KIO02294.1 hypothetical protein M404DRAFT_148106 [Pisolithus tinctorius Marx 270]